MSTNSLLKDLFWVFFIEHSQSEPHIDRIFVSYSAITEFVHRDFNLLCANG